MHSKCHNWISCFILQCTELKWIWYHWWLDGVLGFPARKCIMNEACTPYLCWTLSRSCHLNSHMYYICNMTPRLQCSCHFSVLITVNKKNCMHYHCICDLVIWNEYFFKLKNSIKRSLESMNVLYYSIMSVKITFWLWPTKCVACSVSSYLLSVCARVLLIQQGSEAHNHFSICQLFGQRSTFCMMYWF